MHRCEKKIIINGVDFSVIIEKKNYKDKLEIRELKKENNNN